MLTRALIAELAGAEAPGEPLQAAQGVSFHSDRVRPNDAFFAIAGERGHGIDFADKALQAGASFIVSDRPHPRGVEVPDPKATLIALGQHARNRLHGAVIGVTGSSGKTSTKTMIAKALAAPASPGNFNTPLALSEVLVRHWLAAGDKSDAPLVLELGIDHVGEMALLVSVAKPTHGVLTLIAPAHLDGLVDTATIAREKGRLLDAAAQTYAGAACARYLTAEQLRRCLLYGLAEDEGARATVTVLADGARGPTLSYKGVAFDLPYPGRAMARNAAGALAVAEALGVEPAVAAKRLESVRLEPGRLEAIKLGELTLLDDSYNSNPASASVALEVLRASPPPRAAILGDMLELGREAEAHHRRLGDSTRGLERVIAIGAHAGDIRYGNPRAEAYATLEDAYAAVQGLPRQGTVLIKGSRGTRLERVVSYLKGATVTP